MSSVNKVIILGNVGRDPEMRYLPDGRASCNISIATSTKRKDKNTGETVEDTQWHRVTFYERLAEIAGEYVRKGKPVYIEGRLKYGKYTDQAGVEKNTCDIIATELQLLGGRDDNQQAPRQQAPAQAPRQQAAPQQYQQAPRQQAPQQHQQAPRQAAPQRQQPMQGGGGSGFENMDDDIPFISASMQHDMADPIARRMRKYHF